MNPPTATENCSRKNPTFPPMRRMCLCGRVATCKSAGLWSCERCARIEGDCRLTGGPDTGDTAFYERLSRRAGRRIVPGTAKFAGEFRVGC